MRLMMIGILALAWCSASFAAESPEKKDDDKLICRNILKTGSRVDREKVCATAEQWKQISRRGRDYVRDMQARAGRSGMPSGQ